MYRQVVPAVLEKFGVQYAAIRDVQKGYRNESYPVRLQNDKIVNLLFYKREPGIEERIARADEVAAWVAGAGYPVRVRHDPRTLRLSNAKRPTYAALYNYLPGHTIPWEAYTKKHIKLLGMAMSDMHACLANMPAEWSDACRITDELTDLSDRMQAYFSDENVTRAMRQKLGIAIDLETIRRFRTLIRLFDSDKTQQPLHMDMVRGNVLFSSASTDDTWQIGDIALTGVIDFEKTAYGHPLFDIARTLAFLLVDCAVKDEAKIRRYFLFSGYNKRGQASYDYKAGFAGVTHGQLLDGLVEFFLLHDLYKFLCHAPYESLKANHHYIRTRNILIRHGMVRYYK